MMTNTCKLAKLKLVHQFSTNQYLYCLYFHYMDIHVYKYKYAYMQMYIPLHISIHINIYMYTHIHTHIHTHILYTYIFTYIFTCTYTYTYTHTYYCRKKRSCQQTNFLQYVPSKFSHPN